MKCPLCGRVHSDACRPDALTSGLQTRTFVSPALHTRAAADATARRGISGIAIPWDFDYVIWPGELIERIARGAVVESDRFLFYRHREHVGTYTAADGVDGWEVDGLVSDTTIGRDMMTLVDDCLADGVAPGFSIGFDSLASTIEVVDGVTIVTHTAIHVRETSVVPHPAYTTALVTSTRSKGNHLMPCNTCGLVHTGSCAAPNVAPAFDATQLREELAEIRRSMATMSITDRPTGPGDARTAGQLVRSAVLGDATAVATLERAYTGGTSADDFGRPVWAADLTRLVEQADPLADVFSTGTLPETGMTLEFGRLKSNTVTVAKQATEGAALPLGNIAVETDSVPVETYGGAAKLTIQEIKRSQAPLLDMHFRALAIEAGKARANDKIATANAVIAANSGLAVTVTGPGWKPWVPAIVEAVNHFRTVGVGLNGIILPEAAWIILAQLDDADGRPMLTVANDGTNSIGSFNVTNLDGQLLSVPTRLVPGLTTPAFFNKLALRQYTSPLVRVTNDMSALDLTTPVGVYQFGAIADEIPEALVPITITA